MELNPVVIRERTIVRANEIIPNDQIRVGYNHRSVWGIVWTNKNGELTLLDPWYVGPQFDAKGRLLGAFKWHMHPAAVMEVWR
jgi:hypothetical protein